MADEIEQINRILSAPPEGTGDNVYDGAIDPREVGVEALNAGALSDEEFLMAEEFLNALPKEAQKGFIESLIKEPRATIKSVIDTLFGGGQEMLRRQMSNDNGSSFDNLVDRTMSGAGTQLKGPLSNSELEMLLQAQSGDEGPRASSGALSAITEGKMPLGATGVVAGRDGGRIFTGGVKSLQDMQRDDMERYDPPDLRKQEEILMRNLTGR